MNNKNINTQVYAQKVELLLRLVPIIMDEGVFAVHGGTAINLFLKDLPRYSVDIDLTQEFEDTRARLIADVNALMTDADKRFLVSFEKGTPAWDGYEFEYLKEYPSVKWKLLNLAKLAKQNPQKLEEEAAKLEEIFKTTL